MATDDDTCGKEAKQVYAIETAMTVSRFENGFDALTRGKAKKKLHDFRRLLFLHGFVIVVLQSAHDDNCKNQEDHAAENKIIIYVCLYILLIGQNSPNY